MRTATLLMSLLLIAVCERKGFVDPSDDTDNTDLTLTSAAFGHGQHIPEEHTCAGANLSPDLQWTGVPEASESLVLLIEEAPSSGPAGVHWLVFNILPSATGLSAGIVSDTLTNLGIVEGTTDFDSNGYVGPCPDSGTHQYNIILMALDITTNLGHRAGYTEVELIGRNHILAADTLVTFFTAP